MFPGIFFFLTPGVGKEICCPTILTAKSLGSKATVFKKIRGGGGVGVGGTAGLLTPSPLEFLLLVLARKLAVGS